MQILPKPCPKCGAKAKTIRGLPNMGNSKTRFAFVQCLNPDCKYRTPKLTPMVGEKDKELRIRAIELWNSENF